MQEKLEKNDKLASQRDWPKVHGPPLYIENFFIFYSLRFPQIQRIGVSPQRTFLTDANSPVMQLSMRAMVWKNGMGEQEMKKPRNTFVYVHVNYSKKHNFQSDFCDMQSAPLQPI